MANQMTTEQFKFSGQAGEYFGILFTNSMLTMITLGLYSPWAKVRSLQYLYANTELANGTFQFTANPKKMLVSRIIAFLLFVLYLTSESLNFTGSSYIFLAILGLYLIFAPIITVFVASFRLRYSTWRGINFNFNKDYKGSYRVYLAPLVLIFLCLSALFLPFNSESVEKFLGMHDHEVYYAEWANEHGLTETQEAIDETIQQDVEETLEDDGAVDEEPTYINGYFFIPSGVFLLLFLLLLPYFDFINMRFLARNVRFGTATFAYKASASDYYKVYWIWLLFTSALAAMWFLNVYFELSLEMFLIILTVLYFPISKAYLKSRRYNLVLGKTSIDNDKFRFTANVPFFKLFALILSNTLVILLTFGLMRAWAIIRTTRFMLKYTTLEASISADDFLAHQNEEMSAIGEELADVFDLDVGI